MFTIVLIKESTGRPETDVEVVAWVERPFWEGDTRLEPQKTNVRGMAHFEHDSCKGEIMIRGQIVYKGELKGKVVIYL